MEKLTFLEKIQILFNNILAHPFFILLLLLPVFLMFYNKKMTKKRIIIIYIAVIFIVLFVGRTTIFSLLDNVVDGIFMALYFPNFITLFIVEVLSAVITLITFLKIDIAKSRKIINIVSFAIIQTIFCLILTVVQIHDINIYEENAIYSNNDLLTLMQLLMGTFFLQVVTLLVITAIDKVTERLDEKETKPHHITHDPIPVKTIIKEPEITLPKIKPVKPLDKTIIKSEKIKPLELNEILKKEAKQKELLKPPVAKELPKVQAESLYLSKKELPKVKAEPLNIEKRKQKPTWVPQEKIQTIYEKPKTEKKEFTFFDFKPEFPDAKNKVTSMMPKVNHEPKLEPVVIKAENKNNEKTKPIKQEVESPKPVIKPVQPKIAVKPKKKPTINFYKQKPKINKTELITNLRIINFEKTIKVVKNIKIIYTL